MPRLFIALDPSDLQRAALHRLRTDAFPARWTPPEQYHLTLRFLGDTPSERASALKDALTDVAAAPCPIEGTGLGTFPSLRTPRVLYACVTPAPALMELQKRVDALCERLGFAAARHSFTPHLTVARLRKAEPATVYRFVRSYAGWTYPLHTAKQLTLYESRLRAEGALHTAVARIPLRE
ncbi:MAG: RNA 2',3'-cyclic phosphodiesterase [Bacteroidetes bacterium]|jgi:2'-5' RNA ligase|nr:RNA 2',3'-cyclic phosphodiesterase [Bacteroidota bacterium]